MKMNRLDSGLKFGETLAGYSKVFYFNGPVELDLRQLAVVYNLLFL